MAKGSSVFAATRRSRSSPVNTDDPWPDLDEADYRVLVMPKKLHRWAVADPGRRVPDLV
jgi:hypothetical protein